MYGDIQSMGVMEVSLSEAFVMGPWDTVAPVNSYFTLDLSSANYPQLSGINIDTDVITGFQVPLNVSYNDQFVFQNPIILSNGVVRLNILSLVSPNGGVSLSAGTKIKFVVARSRSINSGVLS